MPCDYSKYPKDWKAIRTEVLERAEHRCEQCKALHKDWVWRGSTDGRPIYQTADMVVRCADTGEHVADTCLDLHDVTGLNGDKLTRIVLTISHTDHDLTNNGEPGNRPNLRALCQRCHLKHDAHLHKANARTTNERKKGLQSLF